MTSDGEIGAGRADSMWARVRDGVPRVAATEDPALRRWQGRELLVVLAVFPLGSAFAALSSLIQRLETGFPVTSRSAILTTSAWQSGVLEAAARVIGLAPALLVAYLLGRSGERFSSLDLDRRRLRMDLALLLPVFLVVQWLPQGVGTHLLTWWHLQRFGLLDPLARFPAPFTFSNLFVAIEAGVVEEVIVLGYLVRRLQQRGVSTGWIVAVAVAVRASYHLYYGWGVLPIVLWALATVLVYLRVRRLLPIILCHVAWDLAIPVRYYYPTFYRVAWVVVLVASIGAFLRWVGWAPTPDEPEVGDPPPDAVDPDEAAASAAIHWSTAPPSSWGVS